MEPNDGYNRLREYKDVKGSEASRADMGLESEPIRHKIVTSVGSLDQSVPLDENPPICTRETSKTKTKRPVRFVKKKSFAISRANKPSVGKKKSNPVKKRVKLEKLDPIETEDKPYPDESVNDSFVHPEIKPGASQSSKPNDEDSKSCSASPNHQIAKREKSGARRNIPRSSVMTIWHWLRMRSRCTLTSRKKSSTFHRVQDPFLSLFIPAMISSYVNRTVVIRDESE